MSVDATSDLFPPTIDQDSSFSLVLGFPSNLSKIPTSNDKIRCQICNAFFFPDENFCPICEPEKFFNKKETTCFNIFKVDYPTRFSPPVILLLIDLSLDLHQILSFIEKLKADIELPENDDIKDTMFLVALIGANSFFCQQSKDNMYFSCIESIEDIRTFCTPLQIYLKYLDKSIKIGKSFLEPAKDKTRTFNSLFHFLSTFSILEDVQDIIYLFDGILPSEFDYKPPPKLHLIQFGDKTCKQNFEFIAKVKSSFSLQNQPNQNSIHYFINCLHSNVVSDPQISLCLSDGLFIKDCYGPIIAVLPENNKKININLEFFSKQIPVTVIVKATKEAYQKMNYFSIQIAFKIFSGMLILVNKVFQKATKLDQWIQSIHFPLYLGLLEQRKIVELMKKNYQITCTWQIPPRKFRLAGSGKIIDNLKYNLDVIDKLITRLMTVSRVFNDSHKLHFMLLFLYGDPVFYHELYKSIISSPISSHSVWFPPFIVIKKSEMNQIGDFDDFSTEFLCPTKLYFDDNSFYSLVEKITTVRSLLKK
ncbi:hypothetical protein TRFO_08918 [Tritrichomonas foetus]|uniref:Uncharacterized protein n=1 Tax=Tritrichomonas foetus TaxID=1144522 RepID=A0A1J4JM41_9EUKA|nr:hypothetical protein TRFO_08918 [Tritrichomonas foetus]|eukprot:OHS98340.1 hypothetical protein TRFO_08918 [Tritrichomonas foetus]